MNTPAMTGMALGILMVVGDSFYTIFPMQTMRWYKSWINSDNAARVIAGACLVLGLIITWIGTTEDSTLATLLLLFGMMIVCMAGWLLVDPGSYRDLLEMFPTEPGSGLVFMRVFAAVGVIFGGVIIYYTLPLL